ncbi:MAG: hypothetical protein H0U71_09440 [Gammaproteobacteria bacterium]|nr:hypothetical protein [Gammaproteobacteria bacterium]
MVKSLRILRAVFISAVLILTPLFVLNNYLAPLYKSVGNVAGVEKFLSSKLDQPVHIGTLTTSWQGLKPHLEINDFSINDSRGVSLLHINKLSIGINFFASVWRGQIIPGDIDIQGTHLILKERPNGIFDINDIPALQAQLHTKDRRKLNYLIDSFLASGKKNLRDVDITYFDQIGHKMFISKLSFAEQSRLFSRTFLGQAHLWNQSPTAFAGTIYGSFLSRQMIYTKLHLSVANIPVSNNLLLNKLGGNLAFLQGNAKVDMNISSTPHHSMAEGSLAARDVIIKNNHVGKVYQANAISTLFSAHYQPNKWSLLTEHLNVYMSGKLLPIHELTWQQVKTPKGVTRLLKVDRLPLLQVSQFLINNEMVSARMNEALSAFKPSGKIDDFILQYSSDQNFSIKGKLRAVSFSPWGKFPGIHHLSGELNFSSLNGSVILDTKDAVLSYAPQFRSNIPIKKITGHINWVKDSEKNWQIKIKNVDLTTPEGHALGYMNIFIPQNHSSPRIQSKFNFNIVDLKYISKYFPVTLIPKNVVTWLDKAIKGGAIHHGSFQLNGAMHDFPFVQGKGKFLVAGDLESGILHYEEGWPEVDHLRARVHFEGASMLIMTKRATTLGAQIDYAKAEITDLSRPILLLQGLVTTSSLQRIKIDSHQNPLAKFMPVKNTSLDLDGKWQLALNMSLPLDRDLKNKVQIRGRVKLDNTDVNINAHSAFSHLNGELNFQNDSADSKIIAGELFHKPFNITISTLENKLGKSTNFDIKGKVSAADLQTFLNYKSFNLFQGTSAFNAKFNWLVPIEGHPIMMLAVSSDLLGMKVNLPGALSKTANSIRPSQVQFNSEEHIKKLLFHYGDQIQGALNFKQGHERVEFERGEIQLDSPSLKGQIKIPGDYPRSPLKIALQTVALMDDKLFENDLTPKNIPPMDLTISNFKLKDKLIKNIDLKLRLEGNNLLIKQAVIKEDALLVNATGIWRLMNGQHQTVLNGRFESTNLGAILNKWQVTDNMVKGQGSGDFNMVWSDSPFDLKAKTLNGALNLHLTKGRITKLSNQANFGMDMGRILTLFSLQTLQRRLMLDFSDLTQPGFSFDDMRGLFRFKDGNVFTENASIDGPVAKVRINGRIGLIAKDYNLRLTINPYVTSSLPIVATLTAGPIVGAATWLADKVLSRQVKQMTEIHYNVTGAWDKPNLKKLSENISN